MLESTKPWKPTHRLFFHTNAIPRAKADAKAFWKRLPIFPTCLRKEVPNA